MRNFDYILCKNADLLYRSVVFSCKGLFCFFKTRKKSCSLAEEKSHASYTGHIFSYTGETISPTQEKLFLLHRRSLPFPSSSKVQSFSLHRPSWHRVSTYSSCNLKESKEVLVSFPISSNLKQHASHMQGLASVLEPPSCKRILPW